jgi:undecaprenyl diphosphate synthase
MQSNQQIHVGIVMDGNGRWAERRGLPRAAGHRAGATTVRAIVETAPGLGIGTLTLYAFSADNWRRPLPEVTALFQLFGRYLRSESATLAERGVRLDVVGRRDRIPGSLVREIERAEQTTANGESLVLRIALDYSARDAIRRAGLRLVQEGATDCTTTRFGELIGSVDHSRSPVPPVDVLVRTGAEQRLSDFLLWECAYAELFFCREMWPDFRPGDLALVIAAFRQRERRFGGLTIDVRSSALGA